MNNHNINIKIRNNMNNSIFFVFIIIMMFILLLLLLLFCFKSMIELSTSDIQIPTPMNYQNDNMNYNMTTTHHYVRRLLISALFDSPYSSSSKSSSTTTSVNDTHYKRRRLDHHHHRRRRRLDRTQQQEQNRHPHVISSALLSSSTLPFSSSSSLLLSSSSTSSIVTTETDNMKAISTTLSTNTSTNTRSSNDDPESTHRLYDTYYETKIPIAFQYENSANNDPRYESFPRWKHHESQPYNDLDTKNNNNNVVLVVTPIDALLDYVNITSTVFKEHDDDYNKDRTWLIHLLDHEYDIINWLPEILYIFDNTGIYMSERTRLMHEPFTWIPQTKFVPTDDLLTRSYHILFDNYSKNNNNDNDSNHTESIMTNQEKQIRWPRLFQLFHIDNQEVGASLSSVYPSNNSIPFIMWFGDYTGCNYNNWNHHKYHHEYNKSHYNTTTTNDTISHKNYTNVSVPLFTVAGNVNCHNTIPMPNYQTYVDSKETSEEWFEYFHNNSAIQYVNKISKVIWRGSLTGYMSTYNISKRGIRYHVLKYVHDTKLLSKQQRNMYNIKLTYIPTYNQKGYNHVNDYINNSNNELGIINQTLNYMSTADMIHNYKVILDMDGNSWSSRFGNLLCSNSVILKIQSKYVDYFYYKRNHNNNELLLQPWKHYIPISYDLNDLLNITEYVLSHDVHMKQIIYNANIWCSKYMIKNEVAYDLLDVMENYVVKVLDDQPNNDASSPSSQTQQDDHYQHHWQSQWQQSLSSIMNGSLHMKRFLYLKKG